MSKKAIKYLENNPSGKIEDLPQVFKNKIEDIFKIAEDIVEKNKKKEDE